MNSVPSISRSRKRLLSAALAVLACAVFALAGASTAMAFPAVNGVQFTTQCDLCHSGGGGAPVVTLVSNDGSHATYNVAANGIEWAVFNGSAHVAGKENGSSNTFTVPVGSTYTIFDVLGDPGVASSGKATVTPAGGSTNYTVTASAGANGSISPSGAQTVASGSNATFTITPSSGYHVATLMVDGASVTPASPYVFTNVTANHTIQATFAADGGPVTSYTVTSSAGANGAISPSGAQTVAAGASITFTITPSAGYHVQGLTVDGAAVAAATSYTFQGVSANHTIAASFAADPVSSTYTLTSGVDGGHGTISAASPVTVSAHGSYAFRMQPAAGYHVSEVLVDGASVPFTAGGLYTFTDVTADHTIVARFAAGALPGSFALQPAVGAHGTVVAAALGAAPFGSIITLAPHTTYTFRVKADLGYHVDTVLVDGKATALTSGGLYTFTDMTATHSFAVTFAPNAPTTLSLKASAASLTHGKTVSLTASLKGGVPAGTKVTIQVKAPGKSTYVTISNALVGSAGTVGVKYKVAARGTYYFRAVYAGSASFAPSTSAAIKVASK